MPITFEQLDKVLDNPQLYKDQIPNDAEARARCAMLAAALAGDPLVRRYQNWHGPGQPMRTNAEPWLAVAEARDYARAIAQMVANGEPVFGDDSTDTTVARLSGLTNTQRGLNLALQMRAATPYLWRTEMCRISDAADLPSHTISRNVLPEPIMFWSWETRYTDGEYATNWALITDYKSGMIISLDIQGDGANQSFAIGTIWLPYGRRFPDDWEGSDPGALRGVSRFLKRLAFLNSPYTASDAGHLPRPIAREVQRHDPHGKQPSPEVRVITLRRPSVDRPVENGEHHGVDWQHQWWVRAHYRAQWYPSRQAHEVIWIPSYLKGPSDKPVIEHVYDVTR